MQLCLAADIGLPHAFAYFSDGSTFCNFQARLPKGAQNGSVFLASQGQFGLQSTSCWKVLDGVAAVHLCCQYQPWLVPAFTCGVCCVQWFADQNKRVCLKIFV